MSYDGEDDEYASNPSAEVMFSVCPSLADIRSSLTLIHMRNLLNFMASTKIFRKTRRSASAI